MGIVVNTNVMALNAQHNLHMTGTKMAKVLEHLSSGLRINRAADDAAGLGISEKLRSQIRGMGQASRNAQDGISMIQTAEGSLNETHSILQRMRELAVQAGTATLQDADRTNIQAEVTQLSSELDRIAAVTDFNGSKLLDGSLKGQATSALGASLASGNGVVGITASGAANGASYTLATTAVSGGNSDVTVSDGSGNAQTIRVAVPTSGTGVVDFESLGIKVQINSSLGSSAITGANGFTVANGTGSASLLIGSGFNGVTSQETLSVSIDSMSATSLLGGGISVATQTAAQGALATIDLAIASVSTTRSTLGALQNRLEHTITNLGVAVENLSASESRIRDTDVAEETSKMVSAQILTQAGTSILSQANQVPQGALSLLRGG
jgi:flagellin